MYIAAQHVPDAASAQRQEQLRHWTAEALGICTESAHWEIVRLSRSAGFQPDCRWIAREAGLSFDQVNLALSRLLRLRLLEIGVDAKWKDLTCRASADERLFRKLALARVGHKRRSDTTVGNPAMQFQILSTSADETAMFYSALFGWAVDANNRMDTGASTRVRRTAFAEASGPRLRRRPISCNCSWGWTTCERPSRRPRAWARE